MHILPERKEEERVRVLVIDDEPEVAGMLSDTLEIMGYETLIAYSGREGLARALEFMPDIITLDLNMPGMDGFKVLKELKGNDATRNIPVLIASVSENRNDINKGLDLGARKYFIKPFPVNMLQEAISACTA